VGKEGLGLFELVTQTYKYEFSLKGVKAQEILCHPGGDLGNYMEKMIYGVGKRDE